MGRGRPSLNIEGVAQVVESLQVVLLRVPLMRQDEYESLQRWNTLGQLFARLGVEHDIAERNHPDYGADELRAMLSTHEGHQYYYAKGLQFWEQWLTARNRGEAV